MGIEDAQRRLAAHAQEIAEPVGPPEASIAEPELPLPERLRALLDLTNGVCEPTVLGLKALGLLEDVGGDIVFTLSDPPKASKVVPAGLAKLRLTKTIKGRHKRQMLIHGEPDEDGKIIPLNHVLLSWVAALSGKDLALIDELSEDDCEALMSVAQWIKHRRGNV